MTSIHPINPSTPNNYNQHQPSLTTKSGTTGGYISPLYNKACSMIMQAQQQSQANRRISLPRDYSQSDQRANVSRGAERESTRRVKNSSYLRPIHTTLGIENITSTSLRGFFSERKNIKKIKQKKGGYRLCELAVGLATTGTASGGPGEVGHGDYKEAIAGIGNTSQSVVPGSERSQETEESTSLHDVAVGGTCSIALQVADTEQEESQVEEEEQQEEGNGGLQGAEEHDGSEDEKALFLWRCWSADRFLQCGKRETKLTKRKRPIES